MLLQAYWELAAVQVAVGALQAGCNPAAFAIIGELYPRAERDWALGLYRACTTRAAARGGGG